jgi:teichuronic acid biosynthesis glycosyltransferase TuaC
MKVLVVCSHNSGRVSPFIEEQVNSLRKRGIEVDYFTIEGKGITGYLKNMSGFHKSIVDFKPDLIHAHYGLSGLFANMQRTIPVVTTFHGSDVNEKPLRILSFCAMLLSGYSIFVSNELAGLMNFKRRYSVISCSVDTDLFFPVSKSESRNKLNIPVDKKIVLFSSSSVHHIKNYPLAQAAIAQLDNVQLVELEGYSREQVSWLMNGCDAALLTSFSEGSSQFIKEAMACNCPVVSTDVGNVKWLIGETEGCYITTFETTDVAAKLRTALQFSEDQGRNHGRDRILTLGLDPGTIAGKIIDVYKSLLKI